MFFFTNTTFFGVQIDDKDNFPNFFGTSAAAPHAAAVAALILESNSSLLPAEVYTILENTALDMDDPSTSGFDSGFDFATGYGLIHADAAVGIAKPLCPGDFNRDWKIDGEDLNIFAVRFGQDSCSGVCVEDLDQDGDVDGSDLRTMDQLLAEGCE